MQDKSSGQVDVVRFLFINAKKMWVIRSISVKLTLLTIYPISNEDKTVSLVLCRPIARRFLYDENQSVSEVVR